METTQVVKNAFESVSSEMDEKKLALIKDIDFLLEENGVTNQYEKAAVFFKNKAFCVSMTQNLAKSLREKKEMQEGQE